MLCLLPLLPKQASTVAPSVDHLLWFVIGISVFFTALIFLLLLVFAIKYRRRAPDEVPQQIHGNIPLELTWTIIPIIIVIVIFVWGVDLFVRERRAPMDAVHVYVVGKQWMWKLQHPEGPRGIKTDVLPDRYTTEWFTATRTGRFPLYCDQYCGTFHSEMRGDVIVMTLPQY